MNIHKYDFDMRDVENIINLFAHKLEKRATLRLYNKNKDRSRNLQLTTIRAVELAQKEVQYMINNVLAQIESEEETILEVVDSGGRLNPPLREMTIYR